MSIWTSVQPRRGGCAESAAGVVLVKFLRFLDQQLSSFIKLVWTFQD